MKKVFILTLSLMLLIGLTACSSKPGDEDLTKAFNSSLNGFKKVGIDFKEYMEVSGFTVVDSYKEEPFYFIKAKAHVHMKKSLDKQEVIAIKKKTGQLEVYVMQIIRVFEITKDYDQGIIDEKRRQLLIIQASRFPEPEGSLKAGDEFTTDVSTYKFRKTDNGWMPVE